MNNADNNQTNSDHYQQDPDGYVDKLERRLYEVFHDIPEVVHKAFRRHRKTAFERHPFLFSTLGLLGLVATWQGFDEIIERIQFFETYPSALMGLGLLLLLLTGRLYRHLDQ